MENKQNHLIEYYEAVTDLKKKKNDLQPYRGVFDWSYNLLALEENIKGKSSSKRLAMFDPTKVGRTKDYETQVTYDMLNVLVKKKKVRKLHCQKTWTKISQSPGATP